MYFWKFCRLRSSRSRYQQILCMLRTHFLIHRWLSSYPVLMTRGTSEFSEVSFIRALIPFTRTPLNHLPKAPFHVITLGIRFPLKNVGWSRQFIHSVHCIRWDACINQEFSSNARRWPGTDWNIEIAMITRTESLRIGHVMGDTMVIIGLDNLGKGKEGHRRCKEWKRIHDVGSGKASGALAGQSEASGQVPSGIQSQFHSIHTSQSQGVWNLTSATCKF